MVVEDPRELMAEIRSLSHAIGRLVRRKRAGMLWCRFDEIELGRLREDRARLQQLLPPVRLVASR